MLLYVRQENLTTDYSQVCTPVLTYVVLTLLTRSEGHLDVGTNSILLSLSS